MYKVSNNSQEAILERKVEILTTFVHALMSQAPVQAAEFERQLKEAENGYDQLWGV